MQPQAFRRLKTGLERQQRTRRDQNYIYSPPLLLVEGKGGRDMKLAYLIGISCQPAVLQKAHQRPTIRLIHFWLFSHEMKLFENCPFTFLGGKSCYSVTQKGVGFPGTGLSSATPESKQRFLRTSLIIVSHSAFTAQRQVWNYTFDGFRLPGLIDRTGTWQFKWQNRTFSLTGTLLCIELKIKEQGPECCWLLCFLRTSSHEKVATEFSKESFQLRSIMAWVNSLTIWPHPAMDHRNCRGLFIWSLAIDNTVQEPLPLRLKKKPLFQEKPHIYWRCLLWSDIHQTYAHHLLSPFILLSLYFVISKPLNSCN